MDDWLTTTECAYELGVTRARILQLIDGGKGSLKAKWRGSAWWIHRVDLDEFAAIPRPVGKPPAS